MSATGAAGATHSWGWRDRPVVMLVASGVAAAVGVAVLTVLAGHTASGRLYMASTAAKIEIVTTASLWAVVPSVWVSGMSALRRVVVGDRPMRWKQVPLGAALAVVVAGGAWLAGDYARGTHTGVYLGIWRTAATYAVATMGAYPSIRAMWSTRARFAGSSAAASPAVGMETLTRLRSVLVQGLGAAGVLVSLGVFAAGAQRQAWQAYSPRHKDAYPAAYVLVMGCAVTLVLAVNFVPCWLGWVAAATRELDQRFPVLPPSSTGWQDRIADRAAYAGLLQIPGSVRETLSSSIFVISPLISAAVSLFIPGGG